MKINELIKTFEIWTSNEERAILEQLDKPTPLSSFDDRQKVILKSLMHKSLITKINNEGFTLVVRNDK